MEASITTFITLNATSGVFTAFLCLYAILKRAEIPGAKTFALYTGTQAIYIFAVAFELASDTLIEIKRWTLVEYIGISAAPALGLLIVLQYVGKFMSRKRIMALFVIPAVTFLMVATNDYHHLFYKDIIFREDTAVPMTDIVIGQYYIVHGVFTFGCMLAAVVLLLRRWRLTKKAYRLQLATLITGQFLPMAGAFIYLIGLTPYSIDPVPMMLCLTSAMYIWAIVSTRMLTVIPIAKDSIFESMREGAIVLDYADRVIDYNGAIAGMFSGLTTDMFGLTLDEAWIRLSGSPFPVGKLKDGTQEEFVWHGADGSRFYYMIRSSDVRGRSGESIGTLLMLIDVTEQRLLQDQLKQLAYYDGLTKLLNRTEFIRRCKLMLDEVRGVLATSMTPTLSAQLSSPLISASSPPSTNSSTNSQTSSSTSSSTPTVTTPTHAAAIVLFDIDHFKRINDTYGHDVGDQAIRHVVAIVKRVLKEEKDVEGMAARYGGEEFVIALPSGGAEHAGKVAERIRAGLAAEALRGSFGSFVITASFGISILGEEDSGQTLESLLKDADAALYEAKRAGRNMVRMFKRRRS